MSSPRLLEIAVSHTPGQVHEMHYLLRFVKVRFHCHVSNPSLRPISFTAHNVVVTNVRLWVCIAFLRRSVSVSFFYFKFFIFYFILLVMLICFIIFIIIININNQLRTFVQNKYMFWVRWWLTWLERWLRSWKSLRTESRSTVSVVWRRYSSFKLAPPTISW